MNESLHLTLRALNRQLFNPTCIRHNNFDLHIATAKNCGTHWIKYMLSLALAEKYNLPPPEHIRTDSIVGHTKTPPKYKDIPQIAVTHSHPHYLMRIPAVHTALHLPKFVVLVRDIRSILVSIYEKTRGPHLDKKMHTDNVTFPQYLRGDVTGNTRIEDIWGLILFFNAWGAIQKQNPGRILTLRYEDMSKNPAAALRTLCDYARLDLSDDILTRAVESSTKDDMQARLEADETEKIVNTESRNDLDWYSAEDLAFLHETCRKHLQYDFGYSYK